MLTKNGRAALKITYMATPQMRFKISNGSDVNVDSNSGAFGNTMSSVTILLGTTQNPTEPNQDDYAMDNIDSSLTVVSNSSTVNDTKRYESNTILTYTRTVRNDTDADITVTEIGLVLYPNGGSNYSLLAREVLEKPVTVTPGETVAFTLAMG